jgi:hypothetical protein
MSCVGDASVRRRRCPACCRSSSRLCCCTALGGRDRVARYEIANPDSHHHHFIDAYAGAIHPFTDRLLEKALRDTAERLGVQITVHEVILRPRTPDAIRGTTPAPPASARTTSDDHKRGEPAATAGDPRR